MTLIFFLGAAATQTSYSLEQSKRPQLVQKFLEAFWKHDEAAKEKIWAQLSADKSLLKYMQDTKGEFTYGELKEYIQKEVSIESLKKNGAEQDPQVGISPKVIGEWMNWRF